MALGKSIADLGSTAAKILHMRSPQMAKTVVARIYENQSIDHLPPSDSTHPPAKNELRVTLDGEEMHHLEIFNGQEWIDLGEVTGELLKKYDLDPQMEF